MKTVKVEVDHSLVKVIGLIPFAIGLSIVGVIFNDGLLIFAGGVLSVAVLISVWAMLDTEKKCGGTWSWRGDDETEVYVGVCGSCNRWQIRVRGTVVARGRGWKKFEESAEDIAKNYESSVPAIANEFRRLLARLEDDPPQPEEGFSTEAET